jgi:HlyD family secretion protein
MSAVVMNVRTESMDVPRSGGLSRHRRHFVAGAILATLVALASVMLWSVEPAAPVVERSALVIATVSAGTFDRRVRAPGLLIAEDQRWLTTRTTGRIERVLQRPGDAVSADTVVARLSNPELEQQVEDARLALQASEAESAALASRLRSEILQQRARRGAASTAAESARLQSEAEHEAARFGAVSQLQAKRSKLASAQLAEQHQVETDLERQLAGALDAQLRAQAAKEAQLRRTLRLREEQLSSLDVRAGLEGVLQAVLVQEGQQVVAGANVARVARPDRLVAQLRVPEGYAKEISPGLAARIDVRAAVIDGRVRRVSPLVEQGVVITEVELLGPVPRGARTDTSIDGIIDIERIERTLHVARPAGAQPDTDMPVYRLSSDGAEVRRTVVEFGKASSADIIVHRGLAAGDRIVVSDVSEWADQDRLKVR